MKKWFGGFNERNWDLVSGVYTEDAIVHAKEGILAGGQAIVDIAKKWIGSFPDIKVTPLSSHLEKDVIVIHWKAEGTFISPIMDIAATGEKVAFHGLANFRIANDKVVEHWAAVDYKPLQFSTSSV